MPDGVLEGASVAIFCDDVAVFVILDDLDALEDVRVVYAHDGYLLHAEQVLSDLVIDGLDVNDFDGCLRLVSDVLG